MKLFSLCLNLCNLYFPLPLFLQSSHWSWDLFGGWTQSFEKFSGRRYKYSGEELYNKASEPTWSGQGRKGPATYKIAKSCARQPILVSRVDCLVFTQLFLSQTRPDTSQLDIWTALIFKQFRFNSMNIQLQWRMWRNFGTYWFGHYSIVVLCLKIPSKIGDIFDDGMWKKLYRPWIHLCLFILYPYLATCKLI